MLICYTLTMPSNNSWDGRWTGDGQLFARVRAVGRSKKAQENAPKILEKGDFSYDFGDGWRAAVSVKEVTSAEAQKIRKDSKGFMGYDWMITSIEDRCEITTGRPISTA